VTLPGRGTSGYLWSHETTGDADAAEVTKEAATSGQEAPEDPARGMPLGRSVDEVFSVTAKRPGTVEVRFVQARSWEKKPPLDERVLRVVVGESRG
jgi:hypothetical protein